MSTLRTATTVLALAPLLAGACSLLFSLDGLTGDDGGSDATVEGASLLRAYRTAVRAPPSMAALQ